MNILLTCAGRRNYLVKCFKSGLGRGGQILACDASPHAPALTAADQAFIVPRLDNPGYLEALLSICKKHSVRLVVPVHDLELELLARHAAAFRQLGTIPVVSSPQVVARCQDKWLAYKYLKSRNIRTPPTFLSLAQAKHALKMKVIAFPVLVKPRWGSSSIGVEIAVNFRGLALAYQWSHHQFCRTVYACMCRKRSAVENIIIQPFLEGQEYGLDVVNDLAGCYVATLQRRKLVMHSGNTDRAVTVAEPALDKLGRDIGQQLGHVGSLDCDVMMTEQGAYVLDLNPRVGGGYPFSHKAGANLPAAYVAWANGHAADKSCFAARPGVLSSKADDFVVVELEHGASDEHQRSRLSVCRDRRRTLRVGRRQPLARRRL